MKELQTIFNDAHIEEKMSGRDTLILKINQVDISFFKINEKMLEPFTEAEYLRLASLADIGCMKLSALLGRSVLKDYVDLYFICKTMIPLKILLEKAKIKYPSVDSAAFLRALGYYEDIQMNNIIFKNNFHATREQIKDFFIGEIKKLFEI
jgi:hypothetical protein